MPRARHHLSEHTAGGFAPGSRAFAAAAVPPRRASVLAAVLGLLGACSDAPEPPPPSPGGAGKELSSLEEPLQVPARGDAAAAAHALDRARASLQAERLEEAEAAFRQALALDPAHEAAMVDLGYFLLRPSEHTSQGEALRWFRLARLVAPSNLLALCGEGIARQQLGDHEAALPLLEEALRREHELPPPQQNALHLSLALLAYAAQQPEKADAHFRAAREGASGWQEITALAQYATFLGDQGRDAACEEALRALLELDPTHVKGHYLLYRLLARKGDQDGAARERRIHEILRQLTDPLKTLGDADRDQRVALRRQLVEAYPEFVRARLDLIRELLELGRYAEALEELRSEGAQRGVTAELCYLIARARAGQGDLDAARKAAREMKQRAPGVPDSVLRDILDEWKKAFSIDAATYERTFREWLRQP